MKTPRLLIIAALLAGLVGCESTNAPKAGTTASAAEYEYVTPLGSNIPVKVLKGQTATNGVSPTSTMTGEQAANAIHSAGGAPIDRGN